MLREIDNKILTLLRYRDSKEVANNNKVRALICTVIEKAYFLQSIILLDKKFSEKQDDQFFISEAAANRIFRDYGLDEVADVYNELCQIAKPYLID